MGNSNSSRKHLEVKRLEEISGIPRQTFLDMHESSKRKNGTEANVVFVDRSDCRHFINQAGIGSFNQKQVDSSFGFFEHDGKLTTEELFSCAVMLSETMDGIQRLSYVIDTHNPKGEDHVNVSRIYGQKILQCINEFYGIKKAAPPDQVWIGICGGTDKKQTTREQFVKYVSSNDPYQDFLV